MMVVGSGLDDPGLGTLLPLNRATEPEIAGQKAATLARLQQHGFSVPDGWVIPPDIAQAISEGDPSAYDDVLAGLPDVPLAVRSSGVAEDTDDAAYAGQYESLLNVRGIESIRNAIRFVWQSSRTAQVQQYRADLGLQDGDDAPAAILIQPMLSADAAGVAFSANPVTGARDEVVINAVSGLGDRLMAGEVSGVTWYVRGETATPDAAEDSPVLTPEQACAVAELARRVEQVFGEPQDVEWAFSEDTLWLLQARPITNLPIAPIFPAPPPGTWIKEVEHFTRQVSVVQASLYEPAFKSGTQAMFESIGALSERLQVIDRGGELYLQVVPLGERHGPPPPGFVFGLLSRLVPSIRERVRQSRIALEGGRLDRIVAEWHARTRESLASRARELVEVDLRSLSDGELADHLDRSRTLFNDGIHYHFQLSPSTVLGAYGLVQVCREFFNWPEHDALTLIAATADASSAPVRALNELVERIRADDVARNAINAPDVTLEHLERTAPEIASAARGYLDRFGHRILDNEISAPALYERPELLIDLIRKQLEQDAGSHSTSAEAQEAQRARARELLRMRSQADQQRFEEALRDGEETNALREDKVLHTIYFPATVIRYGLLEAGKRLAGRRLIARSDDIFYCTFDEVLDVLRGRSAAELRETLIQRRRERAWVAANPGPPVLGTIQPEPDFSWLPEPNRAVMQAILWFFRKRVIDQPPDGHLALQGTGASPGYHTGPVRIIRNQHDFHRLRPGDVLVCSVTTSAWGILFGTAGALVTDHGGMLSHPAIAAREHGLPAAVGTGVGTTRLTDGQIVTVDGAAGTVEIHDETE